MRADELKRGDFTRDGYVVAVCEAQSTTHGRPNGHRVIRTTTADTRLRCLRWIDYPPEMDVA